MGIKSFLLTGDNDRILLCRKCGKLGMDGYLANVLPHNKQEKVKEFQAKGEIVAMTGDGVNMHLHWHRQMWALPWVPVRTWLPKQRISYW